MCVCVYDYSTYVQHIKVKLRPSSDTEKQSYGGLFKRVKLLVTVRVNPLSCRYQLAWVDLNFILVCF